MSRHDRSPVAPPAAVPPASPAIATGPIPDPLAAPPTPSKGGRKKAILLAGAVAILGAAGYYGHDYWTTGRFMVSTDDAYVDADIALIASRVQGYVAARPVQANQHVKAGDVILRLDDGDYRIALDTAKSRVASADDTLARIDAQIQAAQAAVVQAEAGRDGAAATLRNAQLTFNRVQGLTDRNVAAQAQLDSASEAQDTATADLAKAKAAVTSAEADVAVLKAQRAEAEGSKRELQLAAAQAQRNLDLTVLKAPADGVVANIAVETGDLVSPGTRLAALVPDDGLYIEANFKETQLPGVQPGATVHVTFDALPGKAFDGTVASVSPATGSVFSLLPADNATGNFTKIVQRVPARIALPPDVQANGALRAGLSAVVEVDRRTGGAAAAAEPAPLRLSAAE